MIVSFNKIVPEATTENISYTFCSIFEKDFFGLAQWFWSSLFALVGAILGCVLTACFKPDASTLESPSKSVEDNRGSVTQTANTDTNETAAAN